MDSPLDLLHQMDPCYSRMTRDCKDLSDVKQELLIGRLFSVYPSDIADYIRVRDTKNTHQAAQYLQNYLDIHPWRKKFWDNSKPKEVSGSGRGMGHDRGEPGYSHRGSERKNYVERGRGNRYVREDEKRDERPHRGTPLTKPLCSMGVV